MEVIIITGSDYEIVQNMAKVISSQITKLIDRAKFDKTYNTTIISKVDKYKYNVLYNGNALTISTNADYNIGETVILRIPHGDIQSAYIDRVAFNNTGVSVETIPSTGWTNRVYSFENKYPLSRYFINILPHSSNNNTAITAWQDAHIGHGSARNAIIAMGTVPSVDINVMIQWTRR